MTSIRKQKHRQIVKINKSRKYVTRIEQYFISNLLHDCPQIRKKRYRNIFKACKGDMQRLKGLINDKYKEKEPQKKSKEE